MQIISAPTLTAADAVLFFSYSGSTQEILELLKVAKEQGAKIILVTRFPKSPAAACADVILQCGAMRRPCSWGPSGPDAQLFLIDVLFAEVCRISGPRARTNRERWRRPWRSATSERRKKKMEKPISAAGIP